jgi:hypothetical protein
VYSHLWVFHTCFFCLKSVPSPSSPTLSPSSYISIDATSSGKPILSTPPSLPHVYFVSLFFHRPGTVFGFLL